MKDNAPLSGKAKIPLYMRNVEFIREIVRLSQENFCGRNTDWNDWDKEGKDWDSLSTYKKLDGVLQIASSSYTNYMNGATPKDPYAILRDLNEIRKRHPILKKCFRSEITYDRLFNHDLSREYDDISHSGQLFSEKILGNYICYYRSTNIEGEKTLQTGVLNFSKGKNENQFEVTGVFSLKKYNDTLKIFKSLEAGKDFPEILKETTGINVFRGVAYLSINLLWCNLSDEAKSEHASLSFDLSPKVTLKHPEKTFAGGLGIALSQTSGQSIQSTDFPIAMLAAPLPVSPEELTNQLHFDYSRIKDAPFYDLANKLTAFILSLVQNKDIDEGLLIKLVSQSIMYKFVDLLNNHVFSSHYYSSEQMTEFYADIIRPLRKKDKDDDN